MDLAGDPGPVLRVLRETGAGWVQTITAVEPAEAVRVAVAEAGVRLVRAGIEVAHDDDPGWVLNPYADGAVVQIDVLGEYAESWKFLRDESPEYPEEFQIGDLNGLGQRHEILVTLDFTAANVAEIRAALPGVRGIVLPLADRGRDDVHRFRFAEVQRVLAGL